MRYFINRYKFSKNLKWNCIYNLNNGFYLLGSKFSSLYSCAILALFKANTIISSKLLDKGYATEIHTIKKDKDDSFLISGSWHQCVPCGGHDDYVPVQWQSKIAIETSGLSDEDIYSSIRFSLGKYSTEEEITETVEMLEKAVNVLRKNN